MFPFLTSLVSGIGSLFGGSAPVGHAAAIAQGSAAPGIGSLLTGANTAKFLTGAGKGLLGLPEGKMSAADLLKGAGKSMINNQSLSSSMSAQPVTQNRVPEFATGTITQNPSYPKQSGSYDASVMGIGSIPTLGGAVDDGSYLYGGQSQSAVQPTMGMYFADGGFMNPEQVGGAEQDTDKNIRIEAIMALRGQHPAPQEALLRFARRYGPEATRMLVAEFNDGQLPNPNGASMMASGGRPPADNPGRIKGAGGGVDDLIGGKIEGRQDVYLSDGEYVVPARVVSALGDGSSEHGARVLDEMVDRVKKQGAEHMHDNGRIDKGTALPA